MRESLSRLFGRWGALVVARPLPILLVIAPALVALVSRESSTRSGADIGRAA